MSNEGDWVKSIMSGIIIGLLREEAGDLGINDSLIQFVKDRPGHDRRYAIDSSKVQEPKKLLQYPSSI
jgi:dTDP-D-glucose 4,6-dehydratase